MDSEFSIAGYWEGSYGGTNTGSYAMEARQDGMAFSARARIHEPLFGVFEYEIDGKLDGAAFNFHARPTAIFRNVQAQGFELGVLEAAGRFTRRDAIEFRWTSTLQTLGSATAERRFLPEQTNEVFIVHGRDDRSLGEVESFVRKIGLIPVVLSKQPNRGMPTILDKFERHAAGTGFAIVVFSPDDLGFLRAEPQSPEPRARQNVVFELGYFLGRFSRSRVCVLMNGPVVAPSDLGGFAWTADLATDGAWKAKLRLELAAAGYRLRDDA